MCIFSSHRSWYLSYNTGRDKLRRTPDEIIREILKPNFSREFQKIYIACMSSRSIELTYIDQSQKVKQTTKIRYRQQYTNNLIHQVHTNKCQCKKKICTAQIHRTHYKQRQAENIAQYL